MAAAAGEEGPASPLDHVKVAHIAHLFGAQFNLADPWQYNGFQINRLLGPGGERDGQ